MYSPSYSTAPSPPPSPILPPPSSPSPSTSSPTLSDSFPDDNYTVDDPETKQTRDTALGVTLGICGCICGVMFLSKIKKNDDKFINLLYLCVICCFIGFLAMFIVGSVNLSAIQKQRQKNSTDQVIYALFIIFGGIIFIFSFWKIIVIFFS